MNSPASWRLLAVGENRAFGSNDRYQDEPEAHYAWDGTIPNHARLAPGDALVPRNKHSSIGIFHEALASLDRPPQESSSFEGT